MQLSSKITCHAGGQCCPCTLQTQTSKKLQYTIHLSDLTLNFALILIYDETTRLRRFRIWDLRGKILSGLQFCPTYYIRKRAHPLTFPPHIQPLKCITFSFCLHCILKNNVWRFNCKSVWCTITGVAGVNFCEEDYFLLISQIVFFWGLL